MNYTEILYLITETKTTDSIGNIVRTETDRTKIHALNQAVGTKEFYNATAVGLTPTAELRIKKSNYHDEKTVEYNGEKYSVIRTIPKGRFDLVLVLGIKSGTNG